jgi:hypothetical protein
VVLFACWVGLVGFWVGVVVGGWLEASEVGSGGVVWLIWQVGVLVPAGVAALREAIDLAASEQGGRLRLPGEPGW